MEPRYDVNVPRQMASMTGYEFITSFWDDFVIAERMGCGVQDGHLVPTDVETGVKAIEDTFDRAFREWKSNYKYLTELVMVLNWKIWRFNGIIEEYTELYNKLWGIADEYAVSNLEGEERSYFYEVTD